MSGGFVKTYGALLDSSVWGEPMATRIVWITMLAMADKNGIVAASTDGIARRANVQLRAAEAAIAILEAPDPRSKSPEHEGRRVEKIDGGFRILNYLKYRELQTEKQRQDAERQRRHRETKRDNRVTSRSGHKRSRPVAPKAKAEANTETNTETTKATTVPTDAGKPKSAAWASEGAEWWSANVGILPIPRFGKAMQPAVVQHGWPRVFAAIKCYAADAKEKGKPARIEWCAAEIVRWIEWAFMPATDANGDLTPRGKQALGVR
jgi:hypothetical protein